MELLARIAYVIKYKVPWAYAVAEWIARGLTLLAYGGRIRRAKEAGTIRGSVCGVPAVMRPLGADDCGAMARMFESFPQEHLKFFRPHGLDAKSLRRVLRRRDFMAYGLFVGEQMQAYGLIKLFLTKKAYIGRLVAPSLTGLGLGKFLSLYLYWQTNRLGFWPYSTIHHDNLASLRSAVRPYEVVAQFPNGFSLIRFKITPEDANPPELDIEREPTRP
jgi:hypothetical protein